MSSLSDTAATQHILQSSPRRSQTAAERIHHSELETGGIGTSFFNSCAKVVDNHLYNCSTRTFCAIPPRRIVAVFLRSKTRIARCMIGVQCLSTIPQTRGIRATYSWDFRSHDAKIDSPPRTRACSSAEKS